MRGGGDAGTTLLASILGVFVAVIALVLIAQYTTWPQQMCSAMSGNSTSKKKPVSTMAKNVRVQEPSPRPTTTTRLMKGRSKFPKPAKSMPVKVTAPRQRFSVGNAPKPLIPGIPKPGGVKGGAEVLAVNKFMFDTIKDKKLRRTIADAINGPVPYMDDVEIGFKCYDPKLTDFYAQKQRQNAGKIARAASGGFMFNLPQHYEPATYSKQQAADAGRWLDTERVGPPIRG